ncbi:MAG: glycoside hydrolase family 3 C-terminal domain-containing protein [Dysgonamonadaceae bacterium]|jgi:beta-glucosidase|nr:glycoside hydrolase family 3 C-terminal domain-containing protein [Dysgonamonadaceae bacterium]
MKRIFYCILFISTGLCFNNYAKAHEYPFRNPALSPEKRAADLVSRLTLEEKVAQMLNATPAIERLDIPAYNWWNECLHGVMSKTYRVTVYPQAIGMAAGWDADAIRIMAGYTAEEGRAVFSLSQKNGEYDMLHGLTFWSPNVNIFRDPRWGRGQETYGEDPYLTSILGKNFVHGLQGDDPYYLKAAACAKHFAVHSGPEAGRHAFNATVNNYDLWDTYLPAFKALVTEARVTGVMYAYNAINGRPCTVNPQLHDILRNRWKFDGYVTSDCWSIDDLYRYNNHKTHNDAATAAADAVLHGTDIECGTNTYTALMQAVHDSLISEEQLDKSLVRLFTVRMRLGLFDVQPATPYAQIDSTMLETPLHKAHALKMAQQSIVLLKNEKNILPLKKEKIKKIAVLGPNAADTTVLLGNYNGRPSQPVTLLEGIRNAVGDNVELYYEKAIDLIGKTPETFDNTLKNVMDADVIIYAGGLSPEIEGEESEIANMNDVGLFGGDRTTIVLPAIQTNFMKALSAANKPVIFVMMTGSAIALPWEAEHIPVILNAWYGGGQAGTAIADVIFGNYNPSGRLPVTFYAADSDLPDFKDYSMTNRTYRYFTGKPLYPFGFGLGYTSFNYQWVKKPKAACSANDTIECTVKIKNTGKIDGEEIIQAYVKYPETSKQQLPVKELRYFQRIAIRKGATGNAKISIPVEQLAKWNDETGKLEVPVGKYSIFVGSHSENEAVTAVFDIH